MERVQLSRFCEIVQDFQHGRRGGRMNTEFCTFCVRFVLQAMYCDW